MMIVRILNVSESAEISDYDVEVSVTLRESLFMKKIARGKVVGHKRSDGWKELLRKVADQIPTIDGGK